MKEILTAKENGDHERGGELCQKYLSVYTTYDATTATADALIRAHLGDRSRIWDAIRKKLIANHRDYGSYVMLGDHYRSENPYQACLCYENALFYCHDPKDRATIEEQLDQMKAQYDVSIGKVAIVILSYNLLAYTKVCIESIRRTTLESARQIVVVDNGSKDGSVEWLRKQPDITLIENTENIGFPGGCNQGIRASAKNADIFLLNNDTMLPENALFWLRMGLYNSKENGAAGSVSNYAGGQVVDTGADTIPDILAFGEQINVPMAHPYESRLFLSGFALLVKRSVLDRVGLLDERFFPGNNEDVDLGLRIVQAGYRNVLCKNSFILHFGSKTFEKDLEGYKATAGRNRKKINAKWGFDVDYYLHPKEDLIRTIEEPEERSMRILDVGCGCGASMGYSKGIWPNAEVYGIEAVPELAKLASRMGTVVCGDIGEMEAPWEEGYFDYILMGDILERLKEPEKILKRAGKYLKTGGHIIIRAFNVKHYSVILPLLWADAFSYSDHGILNKKHVRLYTKNELEKLLQRSEYEIERTDSYPYGIPDEREEKMLDILAICMGQSLKDPFLTYHYVLKARKRAVADPRR